MVRPRIQPLKSSLSFLRISKGLTQLLVGPAPSFESLSLGTMEDGDWLSRLEDDDRFSRRERLAVAQHNAVGDE